MPKVNLFQKNHIFSFLLFLLIVAAYLFLICQYVPFAMDEFCQYHSLGCVLYPLNSYNVFRESCSMYDLALRPGQFLPLRSLSYVGSVTGWLYFPIFSVWPSPYSARLMGALFLGIQAWCLSRLFRLRFLWSFLLLLAVMPYAFQHCVDTGPSAFPLTTVFIICLLAKRWAQRLNRGTGFDISPLLIGFSVFLGIWTKLTTLALLPGITCLIVYYLFSERNKGEGQWSWPCFTGQFCSLILGAAIPTWLLFQSKNRFGFTYFKEMVSHNVSISLHEHQKLFSQIVTLGEYFTNPLKTVNNSFVVEESWTYLGLSFSLVLLSLLSFGLVTLLRQKRGSFVVLNITTAAVVYFLVARIELSNEMHHIILVYPFILLAIFEIITKLGSRRQIPILLTLFIIVNVALYAKIKNLEKRYYVSDSSWQLIKVLNKRFQKDYAFVILDYGIYYLKHLYGNRDQSVLYLRPLEAGERITAEQVEKLKQTLADLNKKAVFLGHKESYDDVVFVHAAFPDLKQFDAGFGAGVWRVWYEG